MTKCSKASLVKRIGLPCEIGNINAEIMDGGMLLYHVKWPETGTVETLRTNFSGFIIRNHEVYVVFNGYIPEFLKNHERAIRSGGLVYPDYKLSPDTKLPYKDILKNENNKKELTEQLYSSPQPQNVCIIGEDANIFYHEADVSILFKLCATFDQHGKEDILVVSDNTDVFIMLVYFSWKWNKCCY